MKMMVTTRQCLDDLQTKLFDTQQKMIQNVDSSRNEPGNEDIQHAIFKNK